MREISVAALREEVLRVRGTVAMARVYHFSGSKLHDAGSPLTSAEVQAMKDTGILSVFFLDPGETEPQAVRALTTEEIDLGELAVGDVLADTILGPDGDPVCGPGTVVDERLLEGPARGASGRITIRKRGLKGGPEQAASYLSKVPKYPPHPPRPDSAFTVAATPSARPTRPLLAPRARILVTLEDAFQRALMVNMAAVEGHDVLDRRWVDVTQGEFPRSSIDVIVLDLADATAALQTLRKSDVFKSAAVLVTAPEGRKGEVFKAITAGANASVPLPLRKDVFLDRVHGALEALGRRIKVKPAVLHERRSLSREGGHLMCAIQDKFLSSPLPVKEATLLDVSDAGLRIEYRRPVWPVPHAYLAHGVHPQHFWFNYAKDNPLGRDVTVTFPSAAGKTLEGHAKFVHLWPMGDFEVAGLALQRMKSSVREHMSAVRGGTATAIRPTSPIKPFSTTFRRPF